MNTFAGEPGGRRWIPEDFRERVGVEQQPPAPVLAGGEQLVDGIRRQVSFG